MDNLGLRTDGANYPLKSIKPSCPQKTRKTQNKPCCKSPIAPFDRTTRPLMADPTPARRSNFSILMDCNAISQRNCNILCHQLFGNEHLKPVSDSRRIEFKAGCRSVRFCRTRQSPPYSAALPRSNPEPYRTPGASTYPNRAATRPLRRCF